MNRRLFLSAVSTGMISLAGCIDTLSERKVQLEKIILVNTLDSAKNISVLVRNDGEIVYWAEHELAGGICTSAVIEPTWGTSPADLSVAVRLADLDSWEQRSPDGGSGECTVLQIEILHPQDGGDIYFVDRDCATSPSSPC